MSKDEIKETEPIFTEYTTWKYWNNILIQKIMYEDLIYLHIFTFCPKIYIRKY